MKLGELGIVKLGKCLAVRFPVKLCGIKDAALMAGMWLLETYIDERCEDREEAFEVITGKMREHLFGGEDD